MISWIQSTFQHHFKLVFAMLLFAMAIPLVFVYSTSGGLGRASQTSRERTVFGKPYTSEHDRREFTADGQISLQLTTGQAFFSPDQAEYFSFIRAAKISLADKLGIPAPTQKQLESFIMTLPAFMGQDGKYDPQAYTRFLDSIRNNPVYSQGRISRVLSEDWRGNKALEAMSGPGYALDPEVRDQIAAADTVWTVQRATLSTKDIQAAGEPTESDLQQYFDLHAARYRHPPTIQVSTADFPADKYLPLVQQPSDDDIVKFFEARKASYKPKAKEGEQQAVVADPKLEDVRDQVIKDLVAQRAINAATKAASDFAYTLFDKKIVRGTPEFDTLLKEFGTSMRPMQPIPALQSAAGNPIMREALSLSDDKPVSDPVVLGNFALVLFYNGRAEASDAAFAEVRDRVKADLMEERRRQAVVARGEELRAQLNAAVKSGKSFVDAAKAAGLDVKSWENFTRRSLPSDFDTSMPASFTDQPVGEVSPMTVQGDQGIFAFIPQRKEPTVSSSDPNFSETRRAVMADNGRTSAQMLIMDMVRAERIAAGLDRPEQSAAQ